MKRAIASGVAAVGIGAAAMGAGIATQPTVPAAPVVLAAADDETAQQDAIARMVAEMTREEDPEGWDSRYGDGT